jgi:hypothetical protein
MATRLKMLIGCLVNRLVPLEHVLPLSEGRRLEAGLESTPGQHLPANNV